MDRRQVMAAIAGPAVGAGVSAGLASLRPEVATYTLLLRFAAVALVAFAGGLWACLLLTASTKPKFERGYLPLNDGANWLYRKASPGFRRVLASQTPDTFHNVTDAAAAYIRDAGETKLAPLFARRAKGLPLEAVEPETLHETAFDATFSPEKPPQIDLCIRRSDLPKVLRFYEDAVTSAQSR